MRVNGDFLGSFFSVVDNFSYIVDNFSSFVVTGQRRLLISWAIRLLLRLLSAKGDVMSSRRDAKSKSNP